MRSHLTRSVFRRLLANEPIVHRGCLRKHPYSTLVSSTTPIKTYAARNGRVVLLEQQRRQFFNFNIFGKKNDAREPDLDPGIDKMEELAKRQRMNARLPPYEEVRKALIDFVRSKIAAASKRRFSLYVTDTQAQLMLRSLRFARAEYARLRDQGESPRLPLGIRRQHEFLLRLKRLAHPTAAHVELAKVLYESLSLCSARWYRLNSLLSYVTILCRAGSTRLARDLVLQSELNKSMEDDSVAAQEAEEEGLEQDEAEEFPKNLEVEEGTRGNSVGYFLYLNLLRGFIRESDAAGVQHSLSEIEALGKADGQGTVV
jgi:hypothetical protein